MVHEEHTTWDDQPRPHAEGHALAVPSHGRGGFNVEKLNQSIGLAPGTLRPVLARCGHLQRWILQRLLADVGASSCPTWITIHELAAEHAGEPPSREQFEAIRRACMRLVCSGLIETGQRWVERQQGLPPPSGLRRETKTQRRHLCVRLRSCVFQQRPLPCERAHALLDGRNA